VAFVPKIVSAAAEGRLYVISGQSLFVVDGGGRPCVPAGAAAEPAICLGELDGEPCFAWHHGAAPPPDGAAPVPLRQLFGVLPDRGTVEAGKRADLLLLAADPLASTAAFDTIETVFIGGRAFPRAELSARRLR